jgi:heme a synthase
MWLHRYLLFLTFATLCLITAGALVTSNDYGLAVPDWPKSYGVWMPQMIGGVIYEHGHRMIAGFVGMLTVILALWMGFTVKRKWLRNLGFIALLSVIAQAVLGGITVLYFLPTPISLMHATLAQTFFCIIVSLTLFTSREWKTEIQTLPRSGGAPALFALTTVAVYVQLILGAWMRHSKAALAIPDFPLAFGRIIPRFTSAEIAIHFAHRVWAIVVLSLIIATAFSILRNYRKVTKFTRPALTLVILICIQITLGALAVLTKTAVLVATLHVVVGALILATSLILTLRGYRILRVSESEPVHSMAVQPI